MSDAPTTSPAPGVFSSDFHPPLLDDAPSIALNEAANCDNPTSSATVPDYSAYDAIYIHAEPDPVLDNEDTTYLIVEEDFEHSDHGVFQNLWEAAANWMTEVKAGGGAEVLHGTFVPHDWTEANGRIEVASHISSET
jgi:hypothetical protein